MLFQGSETRQTQKECPRAPSSIVEDFEEENFESIIYFLIFAYNYKL